MQKLLVVLTVLSLHDCGKPLVSEKIVGGADSTIGQWPWQVYLKLNDGSQCGGSLISESWVLTAAHCFETPVVDVSQFTVYLGVQKLSDLQDRKIVFRKMKQVIVYPTYTEQGSSGDIALVKLESPVTYTPTILPVCLPANTENLSEGMLCWATGWGDVRNNGPKTLQAVQLPLISNNNCESFYRESLGYSSRIKLIQDDMICAGFKYGQKDACQGDSGGPLVCNIKGAWVQMGIISWGVGCAEPYHPGVYTRVQNYVSWIDLYMASSENSNKLKTLQFAQHVEKANPQFRFNPENSSQSYILYEQNYTESGNLTDDSSEPKTGLLVVEIVSSGLWEELILHETNGPGRIPDPLAYTIYLGVYELSDLQNPKTMSRTVRQITIHPSYTSEQSSGDIALVKLESPVAFTSSIHPVYLPSQAVQLPEGTLCWVTGWGYVREQGTQRSQKWKGDTGHRFTSAMLFSTVPLTNPKTLQKVDVALIDSKNCETMYQSDSASESNSKLIGEDMFCAGYQEGKKDSCQV
ncbi:unnamed protein product [Ranitomeya imitator]|uniref:Peptidase S1 domain-containing protein n=1 Tax=Ranitomeya imitator TaxID=111125 RepID=A0ABN9M1K9_9NEOB|nr:unnamed protein product [Ranitomeya imitator]